MEIQFLKSQLTNIFETSINRNDLLQNICNLLKSEVSHYDWVGFYFRNGSKEELKLAEFAGKPTEHTIIPFGKGICGQVAISNSNFVVPDVSAQDNYISCGIEVKSEVVIPIFVHGKNIGQLDIDSHTVNPFSQQDIEILEFTTKNISKFLENTIS